jgi:hypothetical protein
MYTQSVHVFPQFFPVSQLYAWRCVLDHRTENLRGVGEDDANLLISVGKDVGSCNVCGGAHYMLHTNVHMQSVYGNTVASSWLFYLLLPLLLTL